jgi:hypothetical protein
VAWQQEFTSIDPSEHAIGNGHLHPLRRAVAPLAGRIERSEWQVVFGVLACGCALLAASVGVPMLWARQPAVLADDALRVVPIGLAVLASVFLPSWAERPRAASLSLLCVMVLVAFAGTIAGAAPLQVAWQTSKLVGLHVLFATIWIAVSGPHAIRRFLWLMILLSTLGLPLLSFLGGESGLKQDSPTTFFHLGTVSLLQ